MVYTNLAFVIVI